jgi:hypothetical protein
VTSLSRRYAPLLNHCISIIPPEIHGMFFSDENVFLAQTIRQGPAKHTKKTFADVL